MLQFLWMGASPYLWVVSSLIFLSSNLANFALAQTYYCDADNPCTNKACCGFSDGQGICGYGDSYCGKTCISNCNATAECGEYASPTGKGCPLNVCCSQYGFCGTTEDFCGTGCQGDDCGYPIEPSCSSNDVYKRVIGYYESWAVGRSCDAWSPEAIAASGLTHINYAFALFYKTEDDYYKFEFMDTSGDTDLVVNECMELKENNPGLSLYLSIGGWSFNDGATASYWSDMASTTQGRRRFAQALLLLLDTYGFDGVDLDWEYPVADDRGGKAEDKEHYVALIQELRYYFDLSGDQYGITFTTPSSYWYLQNFDVPAMLEAGADWTNIMTYDLHGVWDGSDPWIGKIVGSHTNLTEIKSALDLMWRAGVDPSRVVLGMGFYGRSFTLTDANCVDPGCPFESGGEAGPCTGTSGVLSYKEIMEILDDESAELFTDNTAAVSYIVWDTYQWVSFDTKETFQQKVEYANNVCLGGIMIWSLDQDTYDWQALSGLLGKDVTSNNLLKGGSLSNAEGEDLTHLYSAYTGGSCYITGCVDWNTGQCKEGYSVLDYVHSGVLGLIEDPDDKLCKTGTSVGEEKDHNSQYRLICCPTDVMPEGCSWEGANTNGFCGNPIEDAPCGDDKYELVGDLFNDRTGAQRCLTGKRSLCCNTSPALSQCSWTGCTQGCSSDSDWSPPFQSPYGGTNLNQNPEQCVAGLSIFCCPSNDTYKNCDWYGCQDSCPKNKVLITQRTYIEDIQEGNYSSCTTGTNKYCCDPPEVSDNWPVDPKYLFEYPDENKDDVSYYYNIEGPANDKATNDASDDPFAFVMIDGDKSAYDESLVDQWTFLTDENQLSKRDLKLHKRHNIFENRQDTFDNVVEKYHIQCNVIYFNSSGCQSIFQGGATNTIVKMPKDIGAGPYARIISLVQLGSSKRDVYPRSSNDIYELTVDYDFAAASEEQKGDVNFRIDYTNLLEYWNDITDKPQKHHKRWFGSFSGWLSKMTTIVRDEKGRLPVDYVDTIKLFHAETYCPKLNVNATFDIDANIKLALNAQYAYYFEGAILPTPSLISAYGYFSIQPDAVILLTMRAEAVMQTHPDPVDIISGITFPGLSIKGLISIGPELGLVGKMDASLSVSGELNAGVSLSWDRTEVYFPQTDGGADASVVPRDLSSDDSQTYTFEPTFNAALTAEGNMNLSLTPEVRFGISVLGGDLMSGYVTAGITNTISLGMSATAEASGDGSASAGFCYWADYIYSLFLKADVSFLNDYAYWGSQYDVASPNDPLTLVEKTCVSYSTDNILSKRDTSNALVLNTTGNGCFGGLISCSTTTSSNDTSLCIDYSSSSSSGSVSKRAPCYSIPALFYNCGGDFFKRVSVQNQNQNTMAQRPYETFISICDNIANYLQSHVGTTGFVGSYNWMKLNYISKAQGAQNRAFACGGTNGMTAQCSRIKESLWPLQVQQTKAQGGDYKKVQGYVESISCDEFPSKVNSAAEGGAGANVACVGKAQQDYQGILQGIPSRIIDNTVGGNGRLWSSAGIRNPWTGAPRSYTVNLVYNTNGQDLVKAGSYSSNNLIPFDRVVGGINLFGNPYLSIQGGNNAVCAPDLTNEFIDAESKVMKYYVTVCTIEFQQPSVKKRDWNPDDIASYVKEVRLPDNWRENLIEVSADKVKNFLVYDVANILTGESS